MKTTLSFLFSLLLISACQRYEAKLESTSVPTAVQASSPFQEQVPSNTGNPVRESLSRDEYLAWVRDVDNGLYRDEKIDDLTFSVFYKPLDYVVLHELASSGLSIDSFATYAKQYEGLQYFTLSIRSEQDQDILRHNVQNNQDYYDRIDYCSFRMQADIQLVEGQDTLACRIFHYERTYQVAPYTNFVLAFEDNAGSTPAAYDKTLIFHDQAFGKGIVKLKLKAKALNQIPKLVIN